MVDYLTTQSFQEPTDLFFGLFYVQFLNQRPIDKSLFEQAFSIEILLIMLYLYVVVVFSMPVDCGHWLNILAYFIIDAVGK